MQDVYIKNTLRYLIDNFQISVQKKGDVTVTERVAIFICFNVVLFFMFFLFWIPVLANFQKEVNEILLIFS